MPSIRIRLMGCLAAASLAVAAQTPVPPAPSPRIIPFTELGTGLPLQLRLPGDYVSVEAFKPLGVVVLCAQEDAPRVKPNGDFSGAQRAVISLRPSASDTYDAARKTFSFESAAAEAQFKAAGATNVALRKWEVRGVPVAALTFEVGGRKIYSLAIAAGPVLMRLSYNARQEGREADDRVWADLLAGL